RLSSVPWCRPADTGWGSDPKPFTGTRLVQQPQLVQTRLPVQSLRRGLVHQDDETPTAGIHLEARVLGCLGQAELDSPHAAVRQQAHGVPRDDFLDWLPDHNPGITAREEHVLDTG